VDHESLDRLPLGKCARFGQRADQPVKMLLLHGLFLKSDNRSRDALAKASRWATVRSLASFLAKTHSSTAGNPAEWNQ